MPSCALSTAEGVRIDRSETGDWPLPGREAELSDALTAEYGDGMRPEGWALEEISFASYLLVLKAERWPRGLKGISLIDD